MRDFQLWNAEDGLSALFDEIEQLALKCMFGNCNHMGEKGCALIDAIIKGIITEEKLKNYRKLQKELKYLEEKQDKNAYLKRKERRKKFVNRQKIFIKEKILEH